MRVTHRTEENLAIASVSIADWSHEFEADLGDLAIQSVPLMLKPLGVVSELGMNLDQHCLTLKIKGVPYDKMMK